jgi:hypothetical protein
MWQCKGIPLELHLKKKKKKTNVDAGASAGLKHWLERRIERAFRHVLVATQVQICGNLWLPVPPLKTVHTDGSEV